MLKEQNDIRELAAAKMRERSGQTAEACPVCSGALRTIKAKVVCQNCGRIVRGCCEGERV